MNYIAFTSSLSSLYIKSYAILTPARKLQDWFRQQKAARELSNLVKIAQPCLSSDNRMEEMLSRLEGCLEQFKLDFAQEKFKGKGAQLAVALLILYHRYRRSHRGYQFLEMVEKNYRKPR